MVIAFLSILASHQRRRHPSGALEFFIRLFYDIDGLASEIPEKLLNIYVPFFSFS